MNISIAGAATTKFGELWARSPRDLIREAVDEAFVGSRVSRKDIGAVFVSNMLSGSLGGQEHLGAFCAEELEIVASAMKVEGACASGGLAVHAGVTAILSGLYESVLVVGVEKMTDHKPEEVARALMGAGSDMEREAGATFPGLYAMLAQIHMQTYGTTREDLAAVAVKNHYHASLNGHAQFPFPITMEKVLQSPLIAAPLTLLDCSPVSDGAAAIILTRAASPASDIGVSIVASVVATDTLGLAQRESLTTLKATTIAAQGAFTMAGMGPHDIDVAEVHDCFTIAEILAMEDIGFFTKGKAAAAIRAGDTTVGGKGPVVNTSGGLKACGHPVGATGVKQIVEVYQQLSARAGKKQVKDARVGLTHNVGGSGATAVVHILKKH